MVSAYLFILVAKTLDRIAPLVTSPGSMWDWEGDTEVSFCLNSRQQRTADTASSMTVPICSALRVSMVPKFSAVRELFVYDLHLLLT